MMAVRSPSLVLMLVSALGGCIDFGTTIIENNRGLDPSSPPEMLRTVPAANAFDIGLSTPVLLVFSRPMLPESLVIEASPSVTFSEPAWNEGATEVTFTLSDLERTTDYALQITGTADNSRPLDYVLSFRTVDPADDDPPGVETTFPVNGQTAVVTNTSVVVTFDEEMDPTAPSSAIQLTPSGGSVVTCTLKWQSSNRQVVCTPSTGLQANKLYTANLASTLKDKKGNPIAATSFSFTTGALADTTAPTLVNVTYTSVGSGVAATNYPANQDGINRTTKIVFEFSEQVVGVDTGVVVESTPKSGSTTIVPGEFTQDPSDAKKWTFDPTNSLSHGAVISWHTTEAVHDAAGDIALAPVSNVRKGRVVDLHKNPTTIPATSVGTATSGDNANTNARVGRLGGDYNRAFVTFQHDLTDKRVTTVTKALATFTQQYVSTTSPYVGGNTIVIESVNYGSSLSASEYNIDTVDSLPSFTVSSDATLEAKTVSIKTYVLNDLRNHDSDKTQVRLRITGLGIVSSTSYVSFGEIGEDADDHARLDLEYEFQMSGSF